MTIKYDTVLDELRENDSDGYLHLAAPNQNVAQTPNFNGGLTSAQTSLDVIHYPYSGYDYYTYRTIVPYSIYGTDRLSRSFSDDGAGNIVTSTGIIIGNVTYSYGYFHATNIRVFNNIFYQYYSSPDFTVNATTHCIGIGTMAPAYKLDLQGGSLGITLATSFPNNMTDPVHIRLIDGGGGQMAFCGQDMYGNIEGYAKFDTSGNTAFGAANAVLFETGGFGSSYERMHIGPDGKVGVANSAPVYQMDVNGNMRSTLFAMGTGGDGSTFLSFVLNYQDYGSLDPNTVYGYVVTQFIGGIESTPSGETVCNMQGIYSANMLQFFTGKDFGSNHIKVYRTDNPGDYTNSIVIYENTAMLSSDQFFDDGTYFDTYGSPPGTDNTGMHLIETNRVGFFGDGIVMDAPGHIIGRNSTDGSLTISSGAPVNVVDNSIILKTWAGAGIIQLGDVSDNVYVPNTIVGPIGMWSVNPDGNATFNTVTANSLIANGGTGTQFLKADGSVDGNKYLAYKSWGQATLVSGTKAVTISGISASNRGFVTIASPGGTMGTNYKAVCTANTLTITSMNTAGTTVTTDTSVINYLVI